MVAQYDALAPNSAETFYHRALALARMGDRDGALADLDRALALTPGHGPAKRLREGLLTGKPAPTLQILRANASPESSAK